MPINELKLAKDLIRRPSVTPKDAGAINILAKNLKDPIKSSEKSWYLLTSKPFSIDDESWINGNDWKKVAL